MRLQRHPRYVSLKRANDVLRVRSPFLGRLRYWLAVGMELAGIVEDRLGVLNGWAAEGRAIAALGNGLQE